MLGGKAGISTDRLHREPRREDSDPVPAVVYKKLLVKEITRAHRVLLAAHFVPL